MYSRASDLLLESEVVGKENGQYEKCGITASLGSHLGKEVSIANDLCKHSWSVVEMMSIEWALPYRS